MPTPPPHRDSPDYDWHARPNDHNARGLYVEGPNGEASPLGQMQGETHCRITAATPEVERRRKIVLRSRREQERDEAALERQLQPRMVRIGNFWKPARPANSGRKKKAP